MGDLPYPNTSKYINTGRLDIIKIKPNKRLQEIILKYIFYTVNDFIKL